MAKASKNMTVDKEREEIETFQMIGLYSFFANDEDKEVDWEEVFDIKNKQF
ncbi:MAG: hypothetical protein KAI17_19270 [Thiotrichaceae bacterium]|nr:hypothetical protein [Thiotrichaceae bacterium]